MEGISRPHPGQGARGTLPPCPTPSSSPPRAPRSAAWAARSRPARRCSSASSRQRAALQRAEVEPGDIDYAVIGQVVQAGAGHIPSRQVTLGVGVPEQIGSDTVNKVCASGMRAVALADLMVRAGDRKLLLAGGMESMSNAPYLLMRARQGYRFGDGELIDANLHDGLRDPWSGKLMYEQASAVADELGLDAGRSGRVGAALARARDRGDRRRSHGRGDRGRRGARARRSDAGRHRRGPAARHDARAPRRAGAARPGAPDAHGRQLARASTTAPRCSSSPTRSSPASAGSSRSRASSRPAARPTATTRSRACPPRPRRSRSSARA